MKIEYLSEDTRNLWKAYRHDADELAKHIPLDISVIFDVGANTGGTTIALADKFKNADVYAFEPFNGNFKRLTEVVKGRSNIYTYNVGFFDELKENIPVGMPTIPSTKVHNFGRTTIFYEGEAVDTVTLVRMSDMIVAGEIPIPDLLFMDVEGCEPNIIRDLVEWNLLNKIPYLYVEVNPSYNNQDEIFNLLSNYDRIYISGKLNGKAPINYLFKRKVTLDESVQ